MIVAKLDQKSSLSVQKVNLMTPIRYLSANKPWSQIVERQLIRYSGGFPAPVRHPFVSIFYQKMSFWPINPVRLVRMNGFKGKTDFEYMYRPSFIYFHTKLSILVASRRSSGIFLSPNSTKKRHFSLLIQLCLLKWMDLRERPTLNTYTGHPCWLWNKTQYSSGVPASRHFFVSKIDEFCRDYLESTLK